MFRLFYLSIVSAIIFSSLQAKEKKAVSSEVASPEVSKEETIDVDLLSKSIGHVIAKQFEQPGFSFNFDKVMEGMREERNGIASPLSESELEQALSLVQEKIFEKMSSDNLDKANHFLKNNKTKKGIVAVDEKLQYEVTQAGTGETVKGTNTPLIHYKGKLLDGTEFGNSYDLGQPVPLPLEQTIQGFSKGIAGMQEGEKRTLFIHPDLGYGTVGHLPPNSLLIFEVEVVKASSETEETVAKKDE